MLHPDNKEYLRKIGGLECIITAMRKHESEYRVLEVAASVIRKLTENEGT